MLSTHSLIQTSLLKSDGSNVETFILTWLDQSVNDPDNANILDQFHLNIKCVKTFERLDACQAYITKMSPYDRTILIVSGSLGEKFVPLVERCAQVSSIYVYCMDQERNEMWAKDYRKIKGIFTEEDDLIKAAVDDYRQQVRAGEPLAFNVLRQTSSTGASTSMLDNPVTRSHLLINFLMKLRPDENDKSELFSFCHEKYRDEAAELRMLCRFQKDYSPDMAIRWYTIEAFPYRMLNKALRTQNIHLLYLYRFWIADIYRQLLRHQYRAAIQTYRGQYMTCDELQLFKDSIGEKISVNSFLSTSTNIHTALKYIEDEHMANDVHRILFEIDTDPTVDTTKPFANIRAFSEYGDEEEVLFSMNSVFRIEGMRMAANDIHVIRMTLCNDTEPELQPIADYVQNRCTDEKIGLLQFCGILLEMKKLKEADLYSRRCLQARPQSQAEICTCYDRLGSIAFVRKNFALSLQWRKRSLEIKQHLYKSDVSRLAPSYFDLGLVYEALNRNADALTCFEKACELWKSSRVDRCVHFAQCYRKLGRLNDRIGKYADALKYHKKALILWTRKNVPTDDFRLGALYYDLGHTYQQLKRDDKALKTYDLALKRYQTCIAMQHLSIAKIFEKIAFIHKNQGSFIQARLYYEKALDIYQAALPARHLRLIRLEANIASIQAKPKDDPVEETI